MTFIWKKYIIIFVVKLLQHVRLAQLDRAFGYGPKGRGFESSSARLIYSRAYYVWLHIFVILYDSDEWRKCRLRHFRYFVIWGMSSRAARILSELCLLLRAFLLSCCVVRNVIFTASETDFIVQLSGFFYKVIHNFTEKKIIC